MELARDGARLAPKQVLPDERLVGLELVAGEPAQTLSERTHAIKPEIRLDPVETTEREGNLGQVGIAGALAHAVDRAVDPARSAPPGGRSGGSGESEVVGAVEVDRFLGAEPLPRAADEVGHRFRARNADRVYDDCLLRTRLDRRLVHRLEVRRGGARTVDTEERDGNAPLDGAPVVLRDTRKAGLDTLDPECVEPARELEFVLGAQHDADRLLTVTQRRVVEAA